VIVAITIVAAVITPPDVVSQLTLAVPMLILFEGSLLIMWFGERKAAKEAAAEVAAAVANSETPAL
jgi:sec-independent protein translocase protein TatC